MRDNLPSRHPSSDVLTLAKPFTFGARFGILTFNAMGHIFYGLFPSFKPSDVYVDGELTVKDYQMQNKELLNEFKKCNDYANKLWALVKEEN